MNSLSRLEKLMLANYRQFHQKPPTVWSTMTTWRWLRALIVYVGGAALIVWLFRNDSDLAPFSHFIVGLLLGMLMAMVILNLRFLQAWPLLDAIIDWGKVDEISSHGLPDQGPQNPFQSTSFDSGNPFQSPGR